MLLSSSRSRSLLSSSSKSMFSFVKIFCASRDIRNVFCLFGETLIKALHHIVLVYYFYLLGGLLLFCSMASSHFSRMRFRIRSFLYKQHFYKNATLKLVKSQAKAKQHPESELLELENYLLSSSTLSSKNNRRYFKK